ncbi:MAG: tRNA (cytidine(34)-2'-O)-methyltransferase [Gallionellaceae bacterium]|nr:MAG: tRNA (cytidine(34)-2'-O)-methyltransferase [Gallionellaceae bacterium]
MFNVILFQPEIPPNTGNIIRLCANSGARLHLIRPLGFEIDDKQLRRAGLDYHEYANMQVHDNLSACLRTLPQACYARCPHPNPPPGGAPKVGNPLSSKLDVELTQGTNVSLRELVATRRLFAFTTKGAHPYHEVAFQAGDAFLFGPESRGLPADILASLAPEQKLRLPMLPNNRSLNLANTVAVAVYEAWRQCGFKN